MVHKYWIIHFLLSSMIILKNNSALSDILADPKFSAPITNVTVALGREAIMTCYVHDLVLYKLAFLKYDSQTILTIQNHVITKNQRISITHTEKRIWQLRIKDVRESDKGWYMCQINTDPMKSQIGYLDVVVPPDILDYPTSQDIIVQEGDNVTLNCVAIGRPEPVITWKREKSKPLVIVTSNTSDVYSHVGPILQIPRITHQSMGAYLCIASNGIPPSVSKRVMVVVNFKPKIFVPARHIYASIGQKIILECSSESNPNSVNYWMRTTPDVANQDFVLGGTYESMVVEGVYKVQMRLTVRPLKQLDFGIYKCVAKNSQGYTEEVIKVYPSKKIMENQVYHQQSSYLGSFVIKNDTFQQIYRLGDNTSFSAATTITTPRNSLALILLCLIALQKQILETSY